jgi:tetratricopeptide (TPR) repeat protein
MSDDVETGLVLYQEALDLADDPAEAAARLRKVIEIQRANDGVIANEDVAVELDETLTALAEMYQATRDWRRLQAVAEELCELAPHLGYAHVTLAVAHAQLGDAAAAAAALARGIEEAPDEVGPRVELARQRLAAGDRAAAIDAIGQAMERGADPAALYEIDDFAPLHRDPKWKYLVGRDHHVQCLAALLAKEHAELAELDPDSDDAADALEDGVELAERLLEAVELADVPTLAPDPQGDVLVDTQRCDPAQLRAIEAVLACEQYFGALSFTVLMQANHLPASADDARERLGLA